MVSGQYELGLPTPEENAWEYVGEAAGNYDMDATIANLTSIFDNIYRRHDIRFIPDGECVDTKQDDEQEDRYREVMEELRSIDWSSVLVPAE